MQIQKYRSEVNLDNLLNRIEIKKLQRPTINHIRRQFLYENMEQNGKQIQMIYLLLVLNEKRRKKKLETILENILKNQSRKTYPIIISYWRNMLRKNGRITTGYFTKAIEYVVIKVVCFLKLIAKM